MNLKWLHCTEIHTAPKWTTQGISALIYKIDVVQTIKEEKEELKQV